MPNTLRADLEDLLQASIAHENVARACEQSRAAHPRTIAAAQSWGPMFAEAQAAAEQAVAAREAVLVGHERWQRATAAELRNTGTEFNAMNEQNRLGLHIAVNYDQL